jgi:hypothetical protein
MIEVAVVPADAVWTSLITGGTGIASALLGYGAARAQHAVEARKMESEERAIAREAREQAKEARRTLYLAYLERIDALRPMLLPGKPGKPTQEELVEWWEAYVDADRKIEMSAHESVRIATGPVYQLLNKITEWNGPDPVAAIKARLRHDHWQEFNEARLDLIKQMRADVGPAEDEKDSA